MLVDLLRHLGPSWLVRRGWHAFARRSGLLGLRMPARPWPAWGPSGAEGDAFVREWLAASPRLPVLLQRREALAPLLEAWSVEAGHPLAAEASALAHGRFRAFSDRLVDLGSPPRWSQDVLDGADRASARHATRLGDAGVHDVKAAWEVSRFTWSATLVRARLLDGDERHAELFWRLLEDWAKANPPNVGRQWMCAQEASLRLIAVAFATQAFRDSSASTRPRLRLAARLADVTARRILADFDYALSQRNNHGVSGAVGLLTAGTLWPGLRDAARWRRLGLETLCRETLALVAPDGGFSQHSSNYHRLLLRLLSWAEVMERAAGRTLPPAVRRRALAATRFLQALMESDGTVHRYGADDGAELLPLSGCRYEDFRPAVGTALALFAGERLPAGPWMRTRSCSPVRARPARRRSSRSRPTSPGPASPSCATPAGPHPSAPPCASATVPRRPTSCTCRSVGTANGSPMTSAADPIAPAILMARSRTPVIIPRSRSTARIRCVASAASSGCPGRRACGATPTVPSPRGGATPPASVASVVCCAFRRASW